MYRPLFYILLLIFNASFWAIQLFINYTDYIEGSPIFLKDQYVELFLQNRLWLISAELIFPLVMTLAFVVLVIVKLRPAPVRGPLLLTLFMAMEFWMVRAFFFPDRMVGYYQLSDPDYYGNLPQDDPFLWFFLAHVAVFLLLIAVREYGYRPVLRKPRSPQFNHED